MQGELRHSELPSKPEAEEYKKIRPQEGMTVEQARNFWDNLFSKEISISAETGDSVKSGLKEGDNSKETDNEKEVKELTPDEINELQRQAIKEAFERIARGEKLTDAEKGNLGEMLMDQYYISKGYTPIHKPRVIDLAHKSGQGIDGVYEKTNPDGTKAYIIADAKNLEKYLKDAVNTVCDMQKIDYESLLVLMSVSIMLSNKELIKKISKRHRIFISKDKLLNMMSVFSERGEVFWDGKFIVPEVFDGLENICNSPNKEKILLDYLYEWYDKHKDVSWYEADKGSNNTYVGYWSFESAALAKIFSVSESKLKQNIFYPVL